MALNVSRGFWRLWLFFSFVWVVFCAWQISDARHQMKKSHELEVYYAHASADAQKLEGSAIVTPMVSEHLSEQVGLNGKIIEAQKIREAQYTRLIWLAPLITFVFARGVPWVWEGFR
jgi:hypothetical protein